MRNSSIKWFPHFGLRIAWVVMCFKVARYGLMRSVFEWLALAMVLLCYLSDMYTRSVFRGNVVMGTCILLRWTALEGSSIPGSFSLE